MNETEIKFFVEHHIVNDHLVTRVRMDTSGGSVVFNPERFAEFCKGVLGVKAAVEEQQSRLTLKGKRKGKRA